MVWLAVWPLVMLGLVAVEYLAPSLSFALRTLVVTGFMVPMITFGVVPFVRNIVGRLERETGRNNAQAD